MRTFKQIIDHGGGPSALARALAPELGLPFEPVLDRVKQWTRGDFIPGEYWPLLARLEWGVNAKPDAVEEGARPATVRELSEIGEAAKLHRMRTVDKRDKAAA